MSSSQDIVEVSLEASMAKYVVEERNRKKIVTYYNLRSGMSDQVGEIGVEHSLRVVLAEVVAHCEPQPGDFFVVDLDGYRPDPLLFLPEAAC